MEEWPILAAGLSRSPNLKVGGSTELVVVQPTSFCNIDCEYCYLPDRDKHKPISYDTLAEIVEWLVQSGRLASKVTVCWHAGEPLVLPAEFYRRAFDTFALLGSKGSDVHHSIQTNATLVTRDHCQVFRGHSVNVGVSLDGPQCVHDAHRKTRDGRGTWSGTVAGIKQLLEYSIDVSAIAVTGAEAFARPDAFYHAFADLGIAFVGVNVREIEGENHESFITEPDYLAIYKKFLRRIFQLSCTDGRVGFRELLHMLRAIRSGQFQQHSSESEPFHIVSFDADGNFSTFSPELLGQNSELYGSLNFGNVWNRFPDFAAQARFARVFRDIRAGVEECRRTCPYFGVCGGGAPSNKLAERGTFVSTETAFCRFTRKAEYDVVLELFEDDPSLIRRLPATAWWPVYGDKEATLAPGALQTGTGV